MGLRDGGNSSGRKIVYKNYYRIKAIKAKLVSFSKFMYNNYEQIKKIFII